MTREASALKGASVAKRYCDMARDTHSHSLRCSRNRLKCLGMSTGVRRTRPHGALIVLLVLVALALTTGCGESSPSPVEKASSSSAVQVESPEPMYTPIAATWSTQFVAGLDSGTAMTGVD